MDYRNIARLLIFSVVAAGELSLGGRAFCAGPPPVIGTVQKVSGTAAVVRQEQILPARVGLALQANDTLRTGPDGAMGVVFQDDTFLSLGPGSALVIDEFLYAPRQGKFSAVFRMVKGTAVYLSGLIVKLAPDSFRLVTPRASVGIRGTKFAVKVEER
jgi:hypothetical protein